MENNNKGCYGVVMGLVIAIAIVVGAFWLVFLRSNSADTLPTEDSSSVTKNEDWRKTLEFAQPLNEPARKIIDEHLTIDDTLRDVNFCGKIYKVKQVIIDGVDVVQRVAELVRQQESERARVLSSGNCDIFQSEEQELVVSVTKAPLEGHEMAYRIQVNSSSTFTVTTTTNEIVEIEGMGSGPFLIGTLK